MQLDHLMTKNVSHKKTRNSGMVQTHVDPPPNPLIKSKHDDKPDKYFVEMKLCRYPTSDNHPLKIGRG